MSGSSEEVVTVRERSACPKICHSGGGGGEQITKYTDGNENQVSHC